MLRDLLTTVLAERRDVLKARVALAGLDHRAGAARPGDAFDPYRNELERIGASAHEFAEVHLLNAVRAGALRFREAEIAELERLLGSIGAPAHQRLGVDEGTDTSTDRRSTVSSDGADASENPLTGARPRRRIPRHRPHLRRPALTRPRPLEALAPFGPEGTTCCRRSMRTGERDTTRQRTSALHPPVSSAEEPGARTRRVRVESMPATRSRRVVRPRAVHARPWGVCHEHGWHRAALFGLNGESEAPAERTT